MRGYVLDHARQNFSMLSRWKLDSEIDTDQSITTDSTVVVPRIYTGIKQVEPIEITPPTEKLTCQ